MFNKLNFMKMERKFKFGLFSSFLARLRSSRPSLAVLKKGGEVSKLQKIVAQLESTWTGLELGGRDKYPRGFANWPMIVDIYAHKWQGWQLGWKKEALPCFCLIVFKESKYELNVSFRVLRTSRVGYHGGKTHRKWDLPPK